MKIDPETEISKIIDGATILCLFGELKNSSQV